MLGSVKGVFLIIMYVWHVGVARVHLGAASRTLRGSGSSFYFHTSQQHSGVGGIQSNEKTSASALLYDWTGYG